MTVNRTLLKKAKARKAREVANKANKAREKIKKANAVINAHADEIVNEANKLGIDALHYLDMSETMRELITERNITDPDEIRAFVGNVLATSKVINDQREMIKTNPLIQELDKRIRASDDVVHDKLVDQISAATDICMDIYADGIRSSVDDKLLYELLYILQIYASTPSALGIAGLEVFGTPDTYEEIVAKYTQMVEQGKQVLNQVEPTNVFE